MAMVIVPNCWGWGQTIKTVGTSGADYPTLKGAFDAINAGTITGEIILQVVDNTTESATAVLNASGTGSAGYSSVLIYPTMAGKSASTRQKRTVARAATAAGIPPKTLRLT